MPDMMGRAPVVVTTTFGSTGNIPATINSTVDINVADANSITFWLDVPTGGVVAFQSSADGVNFGSATMRSAVTDNYTVSSTTGLTVVTVGAGCDITIVWE